MTKKIETIIPSALETKVIETETYCTSYERHLIWKLILAAVTYFWDGALLFAGRSLGLFIFPSGAHVFYAFSSDRVLDVCWDW